MRMPELKSLARDQGLRNYSRIRKAEFVALLQNNGTPEGPRAPTPRAAPDLLPHLCGCLPPGCSRGALHGNL